MQNNIPALYIIEFDPSIVKNVKLPCIYFFVSYKKNNDRVAMPTITTRTMCEVIKSGGVRYRSTAEPGVGSVDRRM